MTIEEELIALISRMDAVEKEINKLVFAMMLNSPREIKFIGPDGIEVEAFENLEILPRDAHTAHHRKHASPCYVCQKVDEKGSHGLCGVHAARVRNFARKFKVNIPSTPTAQAVFFMSIAKGLEDESMYPIMEKLQLESVIVS